MSDNQTRMAGMIFNTRPDYTGLGTMGQQGRSFLKNSAVMNEAGIKAGGLKGIGQVQGAKLMADAKISAANAQADATRSNGMWSMIGSIGGGLLGGMGKWGGSTGIGKNLVSGSKGNLAGLTFP